MSRFVREKGRMDNQRSQDTELTELRLESLNSQVHQISLRSSLSNYSPLHAQHSFFGIKLSIKYLVSILNIFVNIINWTNVLTLFNVNS
jgi:hypothetical protein